MSSYAAGFPKQFLKKIAVVLSGDEIPEVFA
jgi:hypothetical protein